MLIVHDRGSLLRALALQEQDNLLVVVFEGVVKRRVLPPVYRVNIHVTLVNQELNNLQLA